MVPFEAAFDEPGSKAALLPLLPPQAETSSAVEIPQASFSMRGSGRFEECVCDIILILIQRVQQTSRDALTS